MLLPMLERVEEWHSVVVNSLWSELLLRSNRDYGKFGPRYLKNTRNFYWVVVSNIFFIFTPKIGEDEPNLTCAYFSNRLVKNHQLVYNLTILPGSTSFPKGQVNVFQVSGAFLGKLLFVAQISRGPGWRRDSPKKEGIYRSWRDIRWKMHSFSNIREIFGRESA